MKFNRILLWCEKFLIALLAALISLTACTPVTPTSPVSPQTSPPQISPQQTSPQQNLVDDIKIFPGRSPNTQFWVPPAGGWYSGLPANPYPADVQGVFQPRDKILVGIKVHSATLVTFSRYTFFNKATRNETQIGVQQAGKLLTQADFGPFSGEQFLFVNNQLLVPDEPGSYEIRLYHGERLAASAAFDVKK